jgi:hypothetical protein
MFPKLGIPVVIARSSKNSNISGDEYIQRNSDKVQRASRSQET